MPFRRPSSHSLLVRLVFCCFASSRSFSVEDCRLRFGNQRTDALPSLELYARYTDENRAQPGAPVSCLAQVPCAVGKTDAISLQTYVEVCRGARLVLILNSRLQLDAQATAKVRAWKKSGSQRTQRRTSAS